MPTRLLALLFLTASAIIPLRAAPLQVGDKLGSVS
jgi:hypothetical protein